MAALPMLLAPGKAQAGETQACGWYHCRKPEGFPSPRNASPKETARSRKLPEAPMESTHLLRENWSASTYIAKLTVDGTQLLAPRRLTLEESVSIPFSWTPDSKAVLSNSDQNGTSEIFKQATDQPLAESLATSAEQLSQPGDGVHSISQALPPLFWRLPWRAYPG